MNWKVLIVCSKKSDIHLEYYANDFAFSPKNYVFFNLGKERFSVDGYEVVNAVDISGYKSLGRKYAESEVIYNVAKLNLFNDCDYIGIIHSDFNFFDKTIFQTNITEIIDSSVSNGVEFISFFTGMLAHVIGYYDVLLDERKPNCLFVRDSGLTDPKSINSRIVEDIKRVLGKEINLREYMQTTRIALCCSFLVKKEVFNEIGKLVIDAIEDGYFSRFDLEDKHRFPGQSIERYIALYSLLYSKTCFMLDHKFIGGQEDLKKNSNAENY